MKHENKQAEKFPGFPEAAALGMIVLGVVPTWVSEGTGWALLYSGLVTIITYLILRSTMTNRRPSRNPDETPRTD